MEPALLLEEYRHEENTTLLHFFSSFNLVLGTAGSSACQCGAFIASICLPKNTAKDMEEVFQTFIHRLSLLQTQLDNIQQLNDSCHTCLQ